MLGVIVLVFAAAFAVVVLLLLALSPASPRDVEHTLARLRAIGARPASVQDTEIVNILKEEKFSSIAWLDELLRSFNVFPAMRRTMRQANVDWGIGRLILSSLGLWVLGAVGVYMRTGVIRISLIIGGALAAGPWMMILHKRRKRFAEFEEKLPETLDLIVGAIRAGHGFNSAIGLAAREIAEPIAGEFRQCFDEQNFGLDLRQAMNNLGERIPIADVHLIVSAVLIQKDSGGNLAEILEKVAYIIRERFRLKRQVRVHTAQGRITGWILAFAPVVFGVILYLVDPRRMAVLWSRSIGVKLMWTAFFMELCGALIIRKIVRLKV